MGPPRRRRSDSFKDFVLDQLSAMPDLTGRAMFGGYGLYFQGRFFAIIHRGRLFFKTHDLTQPFYRSRGMQPFRPSPRRILARYYEVPLDILEDPKIWRPGRVMLRSLPAPNFYSRSPHSAGTPAAMETCP